MTLVERWYDFICFAIVGLAFLGALVLIWRTEITKSEPTRRTRTTDLYECLTVITTKAEGSSDTTETAHSLLWKSCWPRLAPAWLLAFRFFSFALLSVVLAIDFLDYGASIFLYYTEWTFALVIVYFAIATTVSARGCLMYYSDKAPTGNDRRGDLSLSFSEIDTEQSHFTSDGVFGEKKNGKSRISQSHDGQARIFGYLMQVIYQTCAGSVVLTDIVFWCVIVPFLPNVHLQLNTVMISFLRNAVPFPYITYGAAGLMVLLMGCMHTLNAVTLLIDTSINSLPFPWFRLAYFVLWSCCYIIFQWVIHACGFTWWPYPFLVLSTPWAPLWYFCLAVIHIPCFGFYWLVESARNYVTMENFPHSFRKY